MTNKVLILGGYGNFGKRIACAVVKDGLPVLIAGRNREKAEKLAAELGELAQAAVFDAVTELGANLESIKPRLVVNTCGPFQMADYTIAQACIAHGVHYIDLADGRDFVTGITALDAAAKAAGVSIISGASTVPSLSSAVIEHFLPAFSCIDDVTFGISPGQRAERGLATTQGILSYVGKKLKPFAGHANAYGWQDVYRQSYPQLGKRWMANCDIPDLDLLPARYGIFVNSIHSITRVKAKPSEGKVGTLTLTSSRQIDVAAAFQYGISPASRNGRSANLHATSFISEMGNVVPRARRA